MKERRIVCGFGWVGRSWGRGKHDQNIIKNLFSIKKVIVTEFQSTVELFLDLMQWS